jgi:Ulp1 family protease
MQPNKSDSGIYALYFIRSIMENAAWYCQTILVYHPTSPFFQPFATTFYLLYFIQQDEKDKGSLGRMLCFVPSART